MTPNNTDTNSARDQRLRDTLRLAHSKLENLEEGIKRLRSLQDKLYRHQELDTELDINSKELFILNKESASLSDEATEMDRFETFESIMSPFLRMQMLEAEAEENRRTGNELEQQIRATSNEIEKLRKIFSTTKDSVASTEIQHRELCHIADECSQHDGACHILEDIINHLKEDLVKEEDRKTSIQGYINTIANDIANNEKQLEELNSQRHILQSHESMLTRIDLLLSMLQRLEELATKQQHRNQLYTKNEEELRRAKEELHSIIDQHNDIDQQIQALQDEAEIHRTNIRGMRSYDVQEKVMTLKSHLLMLNAAQSLWRRISTGYAHIEEKTQLINSLRLEIEHDLKAEQSLTISVATLKRQVTNKEYTLNMSKSQNLISLRADLVEGTACSVCGATHHPYHSDTMQDQYKLISDFRSDYETLSGELQGQERQLSELHDKLTKNLGQQIAEQHNLETIRYRQSEDVKEWRVFAHLDPTFNECSASTNSDSRMATIRQLLDNTQRDLQVAETILGEFNYHTNQITTLSGKIADLESKKADVDIRKNETSALCRILAAEGEKINDLRKLAQEKYHQYYEMLQKDITLPEWFRLWQENPENLYIDLRQMASKWEHINREIDKTEKTLSLARTKKEMYTTMLQHCMLSIEKIKDEQRIKISKHGELHERRNLLLPTMTTSEALDISLNNFHKTQQQHQASTEELQKLMLEKQKLEGAYINVRNIGTSLDNKASTQRNLVDLWIRAYNASHPPVQYSELNAVLTQDIDWNAKRKRIRDNRMATSLQQQKVKAIQAQIVALEVETGPLTPSQLAEKQITTEAQLEQHEDALRETTMQIAKLKMELGL
jgi:DNA repair exonuclease SbcCD ATPase subunit